jgi:hypothetical protein
MDKRGQYLRNDGHLMPAAFMELIIITFLWGREISRGDLTITTMEMVQ